LQKDTKLLPLVGPPGVGKSELAYQVAKEGKRLRLFSSVKIINLESKTSTEEALEEIYKELKGITQNRPMLLILDNVEHLPGIVELLHKNILINQEGLSILITSHVSITTSEKEVNPLEVPPTATLRSPLFHFIMPIPPEELQTYDAVQLFLEAVNVNKKPDKKLRITEKNAEAIAAICIGLDGLPMPLIMAASWIDELTPQGVYDLLTEGKILNEAYEYDDDTEHRQSIGKLVAWSFNRLQPSAQKILRRLALFDGPCSEKAILAICTVDDDDLPKEAGELRAILRKLKSHRFIFYANHFAHIMHNTVYTFAKEMLIKEEKEKDVKKFIRLVTNFANYYHRLLAEAITKKQMKKEPERILEIYSLLFHKEEWNFRLAVNIMRDIQEHIINTEMAKAGIDLKSDLANPSIKRADVARKYSNFVVELEEAGKIPYLHSTEILTNVVVGKLLFTQINLKDRFWLKDAYTELAEPHDRTVTIFEDREIDTLRLLLDEDEPNVVPIHYQLLED